VRPRTGPVGTGDALLAGCFAAAAATEATVALHDRRGPLLFGLAGALVCAVLLVRRTRPLLATTVFCLTGAAATWVEETRLDGGGDAFAPVLVLIVLCYSLGAYADARGVLLGAPQPVLLIVLVDLVETGEDAARGAIFAATFVVLLPVVAGRLVRSRRRLVVELRGLERAAERDHHDQLRRVRAEQSVAVADLLSARVESDLEQLLDVEDIGEVERRARDLLATTRDTVVGLSRTPERRDQAPVPPRARSRREVPESTASTWTLVVAAALGTALTVETSAEWHPFVGGVAFTAAVVAAVLLMARRPVGGAVLAWAAAISLSRAVVPLGDTFSAIGLVVALPFLALWLGDRLRGAAAAGVGLAAAVVGLSMDDAVGVFVLTALAAVAGGILGDRSALLAELRARRTEAAERRRDELELIRLEERAALGRELHDSLGHALTVIALQAGAARRLGATQPDATRDAWGTIRRTAAQALTEVRGGFAGDARGFDELVATARAAGLPVTVAGPAPPAELSRVVFRVLQESLTNVLRHAPGRPVEIRFRGPHDGTWFSCSVTNPLPVAGASGPPSPGSGRGLPGLRARVEEAGGTARWERQDGRFRVTATFPALVGARP